MQEEDGVRDANEQVSRTVMQITMLHPTDLDPAAMSDIDVANHMTGGEFLGRRTSIETTPVPDSQVEAEIAVLGGAPGLFAARTPFVIGDDSNGA